MKSKIAAIAAGLLVAMATGMYLQWCEAMSKVGIMSVTAQNNPALGPEFFAGPDLLSIWGPAVVAGVVVTLTTYCATRALQAYRHPHPIRLTHLR